MIIWWSEGRGQCDLEMDETEESHNATGGGEMRLVSMPSPPVLTWAEGG